MLATDFHDATLLIIGHGSTVNGDSGATVFQHAAELRRRGIFAEVREAFFKIEPRIGPTLASIRTPRIFVVPLFVSEGYFTQQAIPCELGLPAGSQAVMPCRVSLDGRTVIYCHPVGTHPLMTQIILARAAAVIGCGVDKAARIIRQEPLSNEAGFPLPFGRGEGSRVMGELATDDENEVREVGSQVSPSPQPSPLSKGRGRRFGSTALVIAGHGTALNSDSRKSIDRQVELIAEQKLFAEVHPAFLEESPRIADIPKFVQSPRIVVVPFFMSDGLHVCEDIPVLLGESEATVEARLKAGEWPWQNPTERNGKTIFYTRGVGSEPGIADVILERVQTASTL